MLNANQMPEPAIPHEMVMQAMDAIRRQFPRFLPYRGNYGSMHATRYVDAV